MLRIDPEKTGEGLKFTPQVDPCRDNLQQLKNKKQTNEQKNSKLWRRESISIVSTLLDLNSFQQQQNHEAYKEIRKYGPFKVPK